MNTTLNATMPNAASYLWLPSGLTTPSITIGGEALGLGAHTITVNVTYSNGCTVTDEIVVTVDPCTGIGENSRELRLDLHPNPATNHLNIQLSGKAGNVSYVLLNYQGQVVYSSENFAVDGRYDTRIDLSAFAKGIYYLRLNSGETSSVRKVVVQ